MVWNGLATVNPFGEWGWQSRAEQVNLLSSHSCSVLLALEPYIVTSVLRKQLKGRCIFFVCGIRILKTLLYYNWEYKLMTASYLHPCPHVSSWFKTCVLNS